MKKITRILSASFLILILSGTMSCQEDFLERKPLDAISDADVWNDPALVEALVNDFYARIWDPFRDDWKVMHTAVTDEGMYIRDKGTDVVVKGTLTPENMGTLTQFGRWTDYYKNIRNCNTFMAQIANVPFKDEKLRQRLTGEVYFLRAYYYFNLVSYWGGVPLFKENFDLNNKDGMLIERSSFADCVTAIVADCDKAIEQLPETHNSDNTGRATKFSAMALKSRLLLYAASDLYNKPGNTNALVGYTDGNQQQRWQAAKAAAKALIDKPGPHKLYTPTDSAAENYSRIFLDNHNPEILFAKLHNKQLSGTSLDLWNGPNGYHNWGGNVPLEEFVSGYQLRDGSAFSWTNPVQSKQPYANRDPRFYASILYNGAPWRTRPADAAASDPVGIIQTGNMERWNNATGKIEVIPGVDTRNSPVENWNATTTGYYTRKFLDKNVDGQFFRGDQPWIMFRFAEILLNYAEACLRLGEEAEARTYLTMVRKRAGMPAVSSTVTGAALLDLYRYERKYELAFEGHRYFDVRRWGIAEQTLNKHATGIEILGKLNPDRTTHTYEYKVVQVATRAFNPKGYFSPIPVGEIQKNPKLKQNPLY
ncbi:RagB/SusD family nutrient uptake outer membrane protein [Larkinella bovis]|uniref:RagB/SusD family nutrient uptake outer membrane protein n=1 Tax=Larkinella bovis TaxID=683041 RepID=A0ABW0ICJ9_9BACT